MISKMFNLYYSGLFNLRGGDISYNPVFLSYAIVEQTSIRYSKGVPSICVPPVFFLQHVC